MKHLKNIVIAVVIGLLAVAITNQLTSSKYPPCDLVTQGIGVSTYGCSDTDDAHSPCRNEIANSESMKTCVQENYYKSKTFPFGFTQHFGVNSNQIDRQPLYMNALASFAATVIIYLTAVYLYQLRKSPGKHL